MPGASDDDDAALAARAQLGDVEAYACLVARHQRKAVRLAHAISGRAGDAEDIAQEAFVKGYTAISRLREGSAFRPWLLAIVANEARNRRRAAGRRGHYELRLATDRAVGSTPASPVDAALAEDDRVGLLAAVRALPTRQRDVVACRYLLELSEAETATVLGMAPGTVKSHLSRALARLRSEVNP